MLLTIPVMGKRLRIRVTAPIQSLAAPSGLSAATISSTEIDLSWTDNSSNETGFVVERSPDGTSWANLATVAANVVSYASTGLSAGTIYYYRVSAFNLSSSSAKSNTASATTSNPVATAYTLTGPSGGSANVASGTFTITPNGTYTGTISVAFTGGFGLTTVVKTFSGSSTPQTFTITPTATGTITFTLSNSGGLTNPTPAPTYVVAAITTINQTFLDNNVTSFGGPPYVLNTAGAYYQLGMNISTPGHAFIPNKANITLDLNGHTITYGTTPPATLANPGFDVDAVGTGPTITGWTITGPAAASATIRPTSETIFKYPLGIDAYGLQCLRLTIPAATSITLSNVSGVATCTTVAPHGLTTGDRVLFYNAASNPTLYNTLWTITVTSSTVFTVNGITLISVSTPAGLVSKPTLVESDAFAIPAASNYYCAQMSLCDNANGGPAHSFAIELWQGGSLATMMPVTFDQNMSYISPCSSSNSRYAAATAVFDLATTTSSTLRCYVGNTNTASSILVYMTRARAAPAYREAIFMPGGGSTYPPYVHLPAGVKAVYAKAPGAFTLTDSTGTGSIVEGAAGFRDVAVDLTSTQGNRVVQNFAVAHSGDDPRAVCGSAFNAGGSTGNIAVSNVNATFATGMITTNRFMAGAVIYLGGSVAGDTITTTACTLTDFPHMGISNGASPAAVVITNNSLYGRQIVPNGYAIIAQTNSTVTGNTIDSVTRPGANGRGIAAGCGANATMTGTHVDNNHVVIQDRGNLETLNGAGSTARALRVRNEQDGIGALAGHVHDNTFSNNYLEARTIEGGATPAIAVWISLPDSTAPLTTNNVFSGNTAVGVTHSSSYGAIAFEAGGCDSAGNVILLNNTCRSNNVCLQLTGSDDGGGLHHVDAIGCTIDQTVDGLTTNIGIQAGWTSRTLDSIRVVSPIPLHGASIVPVTGGSTGVKSLAVGWRVSATVQDGSGNPIAGATCTLKNGSSATDDSGTTDGSGRVTGLIASVTSYAGTTTFTATTLGPHTLSVAKAGFTTNNFSLGTLAADADVTITLS